MSQSPTFIAGNLTDDPIIKTFSTGSTLTKFRLASSRRVRVDNAEDEGASKWSEADALYIDVECWGQLAVNTRSSLTKGMPVIVMGRLVTESWEEDGGAKRSRILLKAMRVAVDLSRYQVASRYTGVKSHTPDDMEEVVLKTRDDFVEENGEVQVNAPRQSDPGVLERTAPAETYPPVDPEEEEARNAYQDQMAERVAVG